MRGRHKWVALGIGQRLRELRKQLGLTQTEFALKTSCTQAFISDVESGRSLPGASLSMNLEKLGYSNRWLITGEGNPTSSDTSAPSDQSDFAVHDRPAVTLSERQIPLVGSVAAGLDHPIPEDVIERLIPVYLGEHADHECFASRVTGHSMEPMFIAGDVIIVDKTCAPENNDVAVVALDETVMLKRVSMDDRTVYLLSINEAVLPIRVSRSNPDARIVGKVIQLLRSRF